MGKYHNKPLPFNKSDPEDMALLHFAQSIAFTKLAKEWLRSLRDGKRLLFVDYPAVDHQQFASEIFVESCDLNQFL